MIILLDLLGYTGERGGTETYARHIARRLRDTLPDAELVALTNHPSADRVREFFPGRVETVRWVGKDRLTWAIGELTAVHRAARKIGADVVWAPANFGPVTRGVPFVLTFHDVTYSTWRGNPAESAIRITAWWMMRRSARIADAILTGSDAAAEDLVNVAGVPRDLIRVVPHGTAAPHHVDAPWDELAPLGIVPGRPVIMSTGNRLPHKNFTGLLEAVTRIPAESRPLTVIPGAHGDDPLTTTVRELGLTDDVVLPGWVTLEQLESLYAVADLYVCPSLNEGFGLPVIDAMRRGCPVLANDIAVLREVGGTAATYADAADPVILGTAISDALTHGRDETRVADGIAWASQFTWEASAQQTAHVLANTARDRTSAGRD